MEQCASLTSNCTRRRGHVTAVCLDVVDVLPPDEVITWPPKFIPKINDGKLCRGLYGCSVDAILSKWLLVSTISTGSILLTSSLAGFIFAKYRFPGRSLDLYDYIGHVHGALQSYMIPSISWSVSWAGFPRIRFGTASACYGLWYLLYASEHRVDP